MDRRTAARPDQTVHDLFCCTERPDARDDLLGRLRQTMIREKLMAVQTTPARGADGRSGSVASTPSVLPGPMSALRPATAGSTANSRSVSAVSPPPPASAAASKAAASPSTAASSSASRH